MNMRWKPSCRVSSLCRPSSDLLALAANELIDELPRPHAPYSEDLTTKTDLPEVRETENANEQGNPDRQPDTGE